MLPLQACVRCSSWRHLTLPVTSGNIEVRFSNEPPTGKGVRCVVNDDDDLAIHLAHVNGVALLTIRGEIDALTAPRLRESVERGCEFGVLVVLDMERVTFMDSSAIGALVAASGIADGLPSSVQIHRPSDQVRRVLTLTGLATTFLAEP